MYRHRILLGVALACAIALAGTGQAQETYELFGVEYTVSSLPMVGTSFDGGTVEGFAGITGPNESGMSLDFAEGATPADDRLFVAFQIAYNSDPGSQLFYLTGDRRGPRLRLRHDRQQLLGRCRGEHRGEPRGRP